MLCTNVPCTRSVNGFGYTIYSTRCQLHQVRHHYLVVKEAIEESIKGKLANKWTGPFEILGVGRCKVGQNVAGSKWFFYCRVH